VNILQSFDAHLCIQYIALPTAVYPTPMYTVTIQLYANSFMAGLNMRPFFRQGRNISGEDTAHSNGSLVMSPMSRGNVANVNVFKETTIDRDSRKDVDDSKVQWGLAEV
jgi:hypothetical protein